MSDILAPLSRLAHERVEGTTEESNPSPRLGRGAASLHGQMNGLTGLRALAALWVVGFHYSIGPFSALDPRQAIPALRYGYLGVDLFFTLSGFVIWHVHARDFYQPSWTAFRRFLALRFARLYPVYIFTMLLFVLIVVVGPLLGDPSFDLRNYEIGQFFTDLSLLQSWGVANHLNWNYPAWSVSAELFCYLLFPLFAVMIGRLECRGTVIGILLLQGVLVLVYHTLFGATMNVALGAPSLIRALIEFLDGCLLRRLVDVAPVIRVRWTVPMLTMIAAAFVMFAIDSPFAGFVPVLMFPVLILAASSPANLIGRFASTRPLVAIGAASYSLYLMQAPVEKAGRFLESYIGQGQLFSSTLAVIAYIVLLAASSAAVHHFVENPWRRRLRRAIQ